MGILCFFIAQQYFGMFFDSVIIFQITYKKNENKTNHKKQ